MKIVFVLVLFIFPSLYIVILGPQFPKLLATLQSMAESMGQ